MRQAYTFLFLGIWLAVLPYLGFPYSWKGVLTTLTGLAIVYYSYMIYREFRIKEIKKGKTFDNFSENDFGGQEK